MLQVRAVDRHRICRRAMDFTALVGGLLGAVVMMVRRVRVVRRGAVMAHVVCRCLVLEMHPGLKIRPSVKTRGVGCGKQTRLKSRHDQEYDRQHCSERYVSQDRDSTNIRHRALGTIVRVICQVRVRKVCCDATKSERSCLLRYVPFRFTSGPALLRRQPDNAKPSRGRRLRQSSIAARAKPQRPWSVDRR